jgi:FkbM family methyltransferase
MNGTNMRVFDIGFYDGRDSSYYLEIGCEVVAFEANPVLYGAGRKRFAGAIASGQLQLHNLGIGVESGQQVDFFLNSESDEWSTFYREAAINWGPGKSRVIQVPCITPREMFAQYGCPDYLKCDIEGFDISVANELQNLPVKPGLVSFEASNLRLPTALVLAGYRSFKLVDQARVPLQVLNDPGTGKVRQFGGGTGPFGDDAEGEWISFEIASYLYYRFALDPFSSSTPPGHWFDIHGSMQPPRLDAFQQRAYATRLINETYSGHCGMRSTNVTPRCPAAPDQVSSELASEVELLRRQLGAIEASRAWKLASFIKRMYSPVRRLFDVASPR